MTSTQPPGTGRLCDLILYLMNLVEELKARINELENAK